MWSITEFSPYGRECPYILWKNVWALWIIPIAFSTRNAVEKRIKERNVIVMQIELNYGSRVLCLPYACVPYLARASADELRVLLMLGTENGADAQTLARAAGVDADRLNAALAFWSEAGILRADGALLAVASAPQPTRPTYTGKDMERIAESSDVRELVDVCQAIFGDIFTPAECETIFYLYDHLHLDFEYIVRLCKFCSDMGKPSLRYLEKVGIDLYDKGVTTVGALESYIAKQEKKDDMESLLRRLFGIGERVLTPKEQEYINTWSIDMAIPLDVAELGYNEMMRCIPTPQFSYLNGILQNWVNADCRTRESVESYLAKERSAKGKSKGKKKSKDAPQELGFDLDEFFAASLIRGEDSEN